MHTSDRFTKAQLVIFIEMVQARMFARHGLFVSDFTPRQLRRQRKDVLLNYLEDLKALERAWLSQPPIVRG